MIEVDDRGRMRSEALDAAVQEDLTAGSLPVAVVASAGATNTGAVDPLAEIADIAARRRLWMHVDAAYGGFAALTDRGREALRGIERAESVTLDPHKWLYQPIEVGALLVRDSQTLVQAFAMRPDYLQDTTDRPGEVNMIDRGLQQTRAVRALKVWMSLMTFGLDAFRAAIERSLDLALHVEHRVARSTNLELLSPAQLSIVCFRRTATSEVEAERINRALVEGLLAAGVGFISSTRVNGRYALRMCVLNHITTESDIDAVLDWFEA
jgi:aromatic-L-amino-acid decarboxylase